MKKLILIITFFICSPNFLFAAGSFRLDTELMPILDQKPEMKKLIFDTFDLHWTGGANRIGVHLNDKIGGARMGPYYLKAKPKGTKGDYNFTIIFHTDIIFLDEKGKKTTIEKAFSIKETFNSFEVFPLDGHSATKLERKF